ncbi:MAG: transglycosylase SLT domain-containing protein [Acetobacteraceae bacterium]|nr:transglycosylase SLT domain-containing protein [Acetobacteraceae bacterium]
MPHGTRIRTTAPLRRFGAAGAALSLAALLAACGGQPAQRTSSRGGVVTHAGHYNRPASYAAPGPAHDPWGPWIRDASRRFDVPERWIREVMRQESAGRVGATSPVGAMGLMQVMPGTYVELRSRYGLGDDPYHPYDSIMAGTAYIREMYDLYGSPAFLAAYNAGPRRLEDYLWNSRGLPGETRNYVARIGPNIVGHSPSRRAAPEIYAAAEIPLNIPAGPRRMDTATMLALREQRNAQQPGIQVAQLPAGPVVRMEPIPDGSTYATEAAPVSAPVQVASLYQTPVPGPVVRMDPIPDGSTTGPIVRMEPIADGSTYPAREASLPTPPLAAPVRQATAAEPRRTPDTTARTAAVLANINSPPPQEPSSGRRFGLIGSAHAATQSNAPRPSAKAPTTGGWAVQVGAFASENLARSAANSARGGASAGRVAVVPVSQGRNTLYRARVTGLSQSAAEQVCGKLRGRGGCMVLSPNAQG